jgi:RNA polymerase sigma-70 factor (ECF subfamily)
MATGQLPQHATTVPMESVQAPTIACPPVATFRDDLLKTIPKLRAYAVRLCRTTDRGDDLVQETLVNALANANSFEPSSNMTAWLYAILRNEFYSEYRKRRREVEDHDNRYANRLWVSPSQDGHVYLLDVRDALDRLTAEHREALLLSVTGLSYDEAAAVCGCAVGTMKSRTSRARDRLAQMLDGRDTWIGDDSSCSGTPHNANTSEGALAFW